MVRDEGQQIDGCPRGRRVALRVRNVMVLRLKTAKKRNDRHGKSAPRIMVSGTGAPQTPVQLELSWLPSSTLRLPRRQSGIDRACSTSVVEWRPAWRAPCPAVSPVNATWPRPFPLVCPVPGHPDGPCACSSRLAAARRHRWASCQSAVPPVALAAGIDCSDSPRFGFLSVWETADSVEAIRLPKCRSSCR